MATGDKIVQVALTKDGVTKQTTTVSLSAPTSPVVSAAPIGPPIPPGGWKCVAAEGFNPAYPLGQASSIFAPNRNNNGGGGFTKDCGGFNTNEVAVFNARQAVLSVDGVHLIAHRDTGHISPTGSALTTGQNVVNYVSGCLSSQPLLPTGGQTGFNIHGFGYLPTPGAILCLEIVCTLPAGTLPGGDFGFWGSSPAGQNELDHLEWGNYAYGHPGWWAAMFDQIDHTREVSSGTISYSNTQPLLAAQTDGLKHRWTALIDGSNRTYRMYVDGTHIPEFNGVWLTSFPANPMNLFLSHGVRDVTLSGAGWAGQSPTFTTDQVVIVRSVAAYQDAPHAGIGIVGGGVAPGTTVV